MTVAELEERKTRALVAIRRALGTPEGEENINLFVQHHLEELQQMYWKKHLGVDAPDASKVVDLLQFRSAWGHESLEYFDFTLPDEVTDYVVSVHFNDAGDIDGISMES